MNKFCVFWRMWVGMINFSCLFGIDRWYYVFGLSKFLALFGTRSRYPDNHEIKSLWRGYLRCQAPYFLIHSSKSILSCMRNTGFRMHFPMKYTYFEWTVCCPFWTRWRYSWDSSFHIFKESSAYESITFRWIEEQFSKEYHVDCNGKTITQAEKVYWKQSNKVKTSREAYDIFGRFKYIDNYICVCFSKISSSHTFFVLS